MLSQDSFFNRIEEHALKEKNKDKRNQLKGKNFEKRVAATLSNPINFEKWKNNDSVLEGLHFHMYKSILSVFGVNRQQVKFIESTADESIIGVLPSGGKVKTDVLTTITFLDGTQKYFTISCKRSKNSDISVHQYTADEFANVLDPNNTELRRTLKEFQKYGNIKDMATDDALILKREIQAYIEPLCKWAIGGYGGEGNSQTQWADYVLFYDNNTETINIHTTLECCEQLEKRCTRGFHTPFTWTYQDERGKNIQLKCRLKF